MYPQNRNCKASSLVILEATGDKIESESEIQYQRLYNTTKGQTGKIRRGLAVLIKTLEIKFKEIAYNQNLRTEKYIQGSLVDMASARSTPISTVSMPRRKIRAHYEHMSEFETGRAIGLKEAGWSNRLIARHLCRSDAAIRRCWQKWVNNGSMQRQDGSGRPRATTEREDKAIVRMAVAAPESTLSTIQRVTGTEVSKMTINRRLRGRNLRARRPLRCLPLTPVHRKVRLQWCRERST
ncbi:hypothetical protein LAZ67_1003785 [Cordylochernes scorpioides]|uniref:Transposase Tc1-like domain-containing protein n=1 Tax=Cordylochernes scorpioides TaxID=51811 RepID=A0ABY6JX43_9ARAC|nr:hypothetical protein LAZ67_1003785 [Cordylochernes scorpioides]